MNKSIVNRNERILNRLVKEQRQAIETALELIACGQVDKARERLERRFVFGVAASSPGMKSRRVELGRLP